MLNGILNFGGGSLAINYLIFCAVTSLGMLQITASRERLVGLTPFPEGATPWLGTGLLVGAFVWFFTVQPDLFIPGLAGGELSTLFAIGFGIALILTMLLTALARRLPRLPGRWHTETIKLADGRKAELWQPDGVQPPLVLALSESATDSLNELAEHIVGTGAAVLLCNESSVSSALALLQHETMNFHPSHRYLIGVGRGADRVLQLQAQGETNWRRAIAIAPFGEQAYLRPGLRWLREADYVTALQMTLRPSPLAAHAALPDALIICGDEDTLIPPESARRLFPSALMVAGARHFTIAAMPATVRVVLDYFELQAARVPAGRPVRSEVRE